MGENPVSTDWVDRVARLARLELTAEEKVLFSHQLGQVVAYVRQLEALDLADEEPLTHAVEERNRLRPDVVLPPLGAEAALGGAPHREGPFFRVPRVIDETE